MRLKRRSRWGLTQGNLGGHAAAGSLDIAVPGRPAHRRPPLTGRAPARHHEDRDTDLTDQRGLSKLSTRERAGLELADCRRAGRQ